MGRDEILNRLSERRSELENFGVQSLYLFGSAARGEETAASDIDILVEFDPDNKKIGMLAFSRLRYYLEEILGRPVDLATPNALRDAQKRDILKEAIRAA